MNYASELAQFNPEPALEAWVLARLEQHENTLSELVRRDAELASRDTELAKLDTEIINRNAELVKHKAEIVKRDAKIEALTAELAHLKRIKFAATSEILDKVQMDLFNETFDIDLAAIEAELEQLRSPSATPKQTPRRRATFPENLPRVDHHHEPESCTCGKCGSALIKIGEDVTEQLDVIPAKFFVNRHFRPKYACRSCETMTVAAMPPAIINGGMASSGMLAWVAGQKFIDHLPLYRIQHISSRHGVDLSRSTLAEWVGHVGVSLQPIVNRMTELLLKRLVLHADETPVPLLDPGKGRTRKAYLWAYRNNALDEGPPIIVFDFQSGRAGEHARSFLNGWQGHLMVDDYAGYKSIFKGDVTELACWAHARRKFFDLHAANKHPVAEEALRRIAELYAIESQVKDCSPEQREALRKSHASPRLEAMCLWLQKTRTNTADGSALAKAIDYSLKRWPALIRYAQSGNLPIDNNPIENAIRPIAIGKNYARLTIMQSLRTIASETQSRCGLQIH